MTASSLEKHCQCEFTSERNGVTVKEVEDDTRRAFLIELVGNVTYLNATRVSSGGKITVTDFYLRFPRGETEREREM